MTRTPKCIIAAAIVATVLGLGPASALAFTARNDVWTYDIDKEDAELGDYSGWTPDAAAGAGTKEEQPQGDAGWFSGFGGPPGDGENGAQNPAGSGGDGTILPVNASRPADCREGERRSGPGHGADGGAIPAGGARCLPARQRMAVPHGQLTSC